MVSCLQNIKDESVVSSYLGKRRGLRCEGDPAMTFGAKFDASVEESLDITGRRTCLGRVVGQRDHSVPEEDPSGWRVLKANFPLPPGPAVGSLNAVFTRFEWG